MKRNLVRLLGLCCPDFVAYLAIGLTFAGLATAPLGAVEPRTLQGHVPTAARALAPGERLDPARKLTLALGLPLKNRAVLTNLLSALYDPSNPQFRQFLTPEQFAEAFGPSAEDYRAVVDFAQSNRFTIVHTHPNRMILDVTAAVADIERAFHVNLQTYPHPTEPRTFYAPDREPWVDASVPVLDIAGLDDFKLPRPLVHELGVPQPQGQPRPMSGSGTGGTYLGKDFRAAYVPGVAATGVGQLVGLLEFDGYHASDITSYETLASLPSVTLSNVLLDSFSGAAGSANIEVALDIELAIAMAPGLSEVIAYEAGPTGIPNDILNRMATDNLAKQLSSSWTWTGGSRATTDQIFQQFAAQGQSFFQAAGDSDAYSGAVPEPADSPYITVVGGTTLSTSGPGGAWTSETTWNWANSGSGTNGTGGGVSTSYTIPTWQQGISMSSNQGSTTMRNIPDVALTADNIWVTYNNGGSGAVGGTSCAAPLWAALTALINQQALGNSNQVVGFINPSLYAIGKGTGYASSFHDITTGNNTNSSSPTKFSAVSGFDLCTGWGTPGSNLINTLAGPAVPQIVSNSLALVQESCTNNAVDPGETVTLNFGLVNLGFAGTSNLFATLQPSAGITAPSAPQSYGALTPGGAAVTRPFTFTANGTCGAILTATLQLQDGASNLGTVTFTIRLGTAISPIVLSENFDSVTAPALPAGWTSAVASGLLANWVSTNGVSDTSPNSAFAADAGSAGQTELITPVIAIVSSAAQLTFRHNYNLASHTTLFPRSTTYYDGGVLQISIGGGAFTDIVAAGGSFVAGPYNCTLATGSGNPLAGASAWGGSSGGWVTTTVLLPPSAAGQNVQLKWACGTGVNSSVAVGWFVDTVSLQDNSFSCCSPSADISVIQSAAPNPASTGQNLSYTLTIANAGPSTASNLAVTDSLPSNVTFVSATPGCVNSGNTVGCTVASLAAGRSSNIVVTVRPTAAGTLTNVVNVTSTTADPNIANNASTGTVTVYVPPTITSPPTNQVVTAGGIASFNVSATGSATLSYQWTFGGGALGGMTSSTLSLANVQPSQAGNYAVMVTNSAGSVTSTVATLTVLVPPSITVPPTNQTVVVGANATLLVAAAGTAPLNYQWMLNGAGIAGATSSSLSLNNIQTNQAGGYCVVVTNSIGSVTSVVAAVTVLVPPSIPLQPASQTVVQGSNATFQAAAAGSSPLAYQWFFGGAILTGQSATTLAVTNVQPAEAGNYVFVVTNGAGSTTSVVAQLTVLVAPAITSQPTNQSVASGGTVSFQMTASGTAPLAYQWCFNGTNAVGANTNTLTLTNVQLAQAGNYTVFVTNTAGSATSAVATLTIRTPPSIQQPPASLVLVQGQNASFNVLANGDAPLNYQWRFNGAPVAGATASSYSVSSITPTNAGNYDVVVTNGAGAVTSAVAQLTVLVPPTITSQPTNQTVIVGSNVLLLTAASGTAPLSYQWMFNGTNSLRANTNALALTNVQASQSGNYCVVVTNSAGSVTSSVAVLTVGTPPGVTQQPADQVVIEGRDAAFTVIATGDMPLAYQWRFNGQSLASGTGSALKVAGATPANSGNYDVIVSNGYGSLTSGVARLVVTIPPSITSQPTNQTVAAGSNVMFLVTASGSLPLSYQWWFNVTNALGANTNCLALTNIQSSQAGNYFVVVANSAGSITSSIATLTLGAPPAILRQPADQTVIQGQNATLALSATGDVPLTYQWRFNSNPLAGGTGSSYTLTAATLANAGDYDAVVSNPYGSLTSALARVTVLVPPSIASQPSNQIIVAGGTAMFQTSVTGSSPLNYQWWFGGTNAVGDNTSVLSITNAQPSQAGAYSVVVTNTAGSITSVVAVLTVLVPPSIAIQPSNQTATAGGNVSFQLTASGTAPLGYQWLFNGAIATVSNSNVLTLVNVQPNSAGSYSVVITNAAGSVTSTLAQLTVLMPPLIVAAPTNQTSLPGFNVSFYANAAGTAPLTYQWLFNGAAVPGATTNTLVFTNVQPAEAGTYSVIVTNAAGAASSSANLKVLVAPLLSDPTQAGQGFSVPVSTAAGLSYLLEFKRALQDPVWTAVTSWTPGTGGVLILQDTNSANTSGFYRVRGQ